MSAGPSKLMSIAELAADFESKLEDFPKLETSARAHDDLIQKLQKLSEDAEDLKPHYTSLKEV